ncbi:glycosyltransferase [uncultured Jatrophihabitans sp.]|uniref:glycosyltransferase n=1 Tax=uncultured Jatrophihabitans sp. TaxID=1610747 RepID=UPI0035CA50D7
MIGYYVHHQGHGHLHRALSLAHALDEPVVGLSSLPSPGEPFADWVPLPPDPALDDADGPDAGGALHWAPTNSPGYADRMSTVADWVRRERPRLVVVDLSVEVATLVRLLGTPVAVVTLPGERTDDAHRLAYRLATTIVAPWPRAILDPPHLCDYGAKVVHTGAISRFDGRPGRPAPAAGRVLVLLGSGGADGLTVPADGAGWTWTALGGGGTWSGDVWSALQDSDVVVTHAGLNALAEVAAAGRPAVVVPQSRPFAEQRTTGGALKAAGLATVLDAWPAPDEWDGVLTSACARGESWQRWNDGQGAGRFAHALAERALQPVGDGR